MPSASSRPPAIITTRLQTASTSSRCTVPRPDWDFAIYKATWARLFDGGRLAHGGPPTGRGRQEDARRTLRVLSRDRQVTDTLPHALDSSAKF